MKCIKRASEAAMETVERLMRLLDTVERLMRLLGAVESLTRGLRNL